MSEELVSSIVACASDMTTSGLIRVKVSILGQAVSKRLKSRAQILTKLRASDLKLRGRKRMVDGPVEKVVERRQRRMIKNRESAARSRARKQVMADNT